MAAREAAAMPLPKDETTPPVTKMYLVVMLNLNKFRGYKVREDMTQDGGIV
jgi:hypothetical protein